MTDEKTKPESQPLPEAIPPGTVEGIQFGIQKVYVKDTSFEAPNSPAIFSEGQNWEPDINVNLNNSSTPLGNDMFEVTLTLTVTAKLGDKTAFLAEVQEAGIFGIRGAAENQIGPILGSYCPNMLFPFARQVISNLVSEGGFPTLLLSPINFEALYMQSMQEAGQAVAAEDGATL
jgi:preprotein translocase subunit SecB